MGQLLYDKASLVNIPSRYRDGKLYNIKPSNADFEFERGTGATRVNENGLIETFYGEATNLLLQSNQFDTTWTTSNADTPTTGYSGYDGSNNAWLLNANSSGTSNVKQLINASGIISFSFYAKAGTTNFVRVQVSSSSNGIAYFDLLNGTVGFKTSLIDQNIESVGGGWFRCSIVVNKTITDVRIYVAQDDTATVNEGDNIYIQDAQLESGYFATPYIETTTSTVTVPNRGDTPRIDYTDPNNPSLLLEPQRTNDLPDSNDFEEWNLKTGVTFNSTNNLSPSGEYNATEVTFSGANNQLTKTFTAISNSVVGSFYVKGVSGETIKMGMGAGYSGQLFTLNGEWQRLTLVSPTGADRFGINTFSGATARTLQIYGAQLEEGSYATSYIPTNGGTETRNADICIGGGDADTFNDSEGVLYVEMKKSSANLSDFELISVNSQVNNNDSDSVTVGFDSAERFYARVRANGTNALLYRSGVSNSQYYKVALKYKSGDLAFWINGVEVGTDTNTFSFNNSLDNLSFNYYKGGNLPFYGNVKQVAYFPEALEDHELERLTSPTPFESSFEDLANNNGYTIL